MCFDKEVAEVSGVQGEEVFVYQDGIGVAVDEKGDRVGPAMITL